MSTKELGFYAKFRLSPLARDGISMGEVPRASAANLRRHKSSSGIKTVGSQLYDNSSIMEGPSEGEKEREKDVNALGFTNRLARLSLERNKAYNTRAFTRVSDYVIFVLYGIMNDITVCNARIAL